MGVISKPARLRGSPRGNIKTHQAGFPQYFKKAEQYCTKQGIQWRALLAGGAAAGTQKVVGLCTAGI